MSDESNKLWGFSRRKLLGSMATIGAAGAIGGAGTMAFFSDEETLEDNRLVAGSLDLKLDWAEYYSDWSSDESAAVDDGDIVMAEQDTTLDSSEYPANYVGLPTPNNALVAIPNGDVMDFMAAAGTEAYPDTDDDGLVDYPGPYDVCVHGADTPEDLDPTAEPSSLDPTVDDSFKTDGTGLRTNNNDTVDADGNQKPLVALDDVKPGDFGEVTFSLHLCDNDGWIALTGEERYDRDNTLTEPERKDSDETDGLASGELAEKLRATIWLDGVDPADNGVDDEPMDENGNNLLDDGEEVLVEEGTLGTVIDVLEGPGLSLAPGSGAQSGTSTFECQGDALSIAEPGSSGIQASQSATIAGASGDTTITIDRVGDKDGDGETEEFSFVVSGPDELAVGDYPGVCALSINTADGNTIEVDYGAGGCVRDSILLPTPDLTQVTSRITSVDFDLCTLVGGGGGQGGECFNGSDTYYVGFAWWLPLNHGNEVQTDSYGFDLGFYAEQCRHNPDGIGNVPE